MKSGLSNPAPFVALLTIGLLSSACGNTCEADADCGEDRPFCVEMSCVECRTTDDCPMGSTSYNEEGKITSIRLGKTCQENKCEGCRCVGPGRAQGGFGLLLGVGALLLLRRRRGAAGLAFLALIAVGLVGCGDGPGSRYADAFEAYQSKACECGGGPVQAAFCAADTSGTADCIDRAYDEGSETSQVAIDCFVDVIDEAARCLAAVDGCDEAALSACGEGLDNMSCPEPSEQTLRTLNSCGALP